MSFENSLIVLIEKLLTGGTLGRDSALVSIENWNIDRHDKAGRVNVRSVTCFRESERNLWKLLKDRRAHTRILAAVALLQCQQIKPAPFQSFDECILTWNIQMRRQPNAWPRLVEVLCDRLRSTDQHIAEVALLQLPVRLAKALLRMADSEAHMGPSRNAATVQLSQRELGNIVGAARESVNKCLRDWQRSGLVRIEGTSITISNRATLEDVAEQS